VRDFESLFVRQMLEVMRKTVHRENDLLNGGLTQDVFEGMLYDQYARKMAETAGFGLADTIYRQVSSK
jgi:flagellar protein FlgJ